MTDRRTIRRALVTGASGFVGSALCAELVQREIEVVGTGRTIGGGRLQWVRLELPGPVPPTALEGVDTVFHLAGQAHVMSEGGGGEAVHNAVNRCGTRDVARAAASAGVERFILMSSVKAMRSPGAGIVRECDQGMPTDSYGLSKRLAEREAFEAAGCGMDVVVLRPALVYGQGLKGNLGVLLAALQRGRVPPLPSVANRRSLVGLGDLVRCCLLTAELDAAAGRTYVITDGETYSTDRIVRALAEAVSINPTPQFRVPLGVLSVLGRVGDGWGTVTGHRAPVDTAMLRRLVGNAEYESVLVRQELGFAPVESLERVAPRLVCGRGVESG